jgi:hypothetical protein
MSDRAATTHPMRHLLSNRRGLLAGAAALVGAGLAKLGGPERARAAHTGSDEGVLHAGQSNTTTSLTGVHATFTSLPTLAVTNSSDLLFVTGHDAFQGIVGGTDPGAAGVLGMAIGTSGQNYGVVGTTRSATHNASGVRGFATAGATNGVWGENTSSDHGATGVYGLATHATSLTNGVYARSQSTHSGSNWVYGEVSDPNATGTGVQGRSAKGTGVRGQSTSGTGVFGVSQGGVGVIATSTQSYAMYCSSNAHWGLFSYSPTFAAVFSGNVQIYGSLTVTGSYPKSAGVKKRDGTLARMYCQEAPEPWFEDFGEATLTNGRATVRLDPEFAQVVKGDDYKIFPVPKGDCKGLYVAGQTPTSFEIRELQGGTSSVPFSYRVVAKRLDDVGNRMEKVEAHDLAKAREYGRKLIEQAQATPAGR